MLTFQSVKAAELRVFDQVMPQVPFAPSITHIVQGREKMCENNGPGYLVNTILRVAGVQGARRSPDSSLRVRGRGYITPNFANFEFDRLASTRRRFVRQLEYNRRTNKDCG